MILPLGCSPSDGVSNCTDARGGAFDNTKSKSWSNKNNYTLNAESNLGMTENSDFGLYGFDTIAVGQPGHGNVSLDQQPIAGLATKDFLLGNLGLANRPLIFDDQTKVNGLMSNLKSRNLIPSLSYGFTAGASYREYVRPSQLLSLLIQIRKNQRKPHSRGLRRLQVDAE